MTNTMIWSKRQQEYGYKKLYRNISIILSDSIINTKITPNMITFCTTIYYILILRLTLLPSDLLIRTLIFISIHIALILDFTDGTLARMKNMKTYIGEWYDMISDKIFILLLPVTIGLSGYIYTNNLQLLVNSLILSALIQFYFTLNIYFKTVHKDIHKDENVQESPALINKITSQAYLSGELLLIVISLGYLFNQIHYAITILTIYTSIFITYILISYTIRIRKRTT